MASVVVALSGVAEATFPGADGVIAFIRTAGAPGSGDVFTVDPTGTNVTQRTFGASVPCAAASSVMGDRAQVSPDGRFIAVGSANGILVIPTQGPPTAALVPGTDGNDCYPAWDPTGRRLVFAYNVAPATGDGTLATISASCTQTPFNCSFGSIILLFGATQGARPDWSPDGTTIAFDRAVGSGRELFTIPAAGGPSQQVTNCAGGGLTLCVAPSYSPDGTRLALTRGSTLSPPDTTIAVVSSTATGAIPATLPNSLPGDAFPSFSPDGKEIALERLAAPFGIFRIAANGFGPRTQVTSTATLTDEGPAWAPAVADTTTSATCAPASTGSATSIDCEVVITTASGAVVPAGAFVSCVPNGNFSFPPSSYTQTTGTSNTVKVSNVQGNPGFNTVTCYFNGAQGFNPSGSSPQSVQLPTGPAAPRLCVRNADNTITVNAEPGTFVSFFAAPAPPFTNDNFRGFVRTDVNGTARSDVLPPNIVCTNNSTATSYGPV